MKLTRTADGKKTITLSRNEWQKIGQEAGWESTTIKGTPDRAQNLRGIAEALREFCDYIDEKAYPRDQEMFAQCRRIRGYTEQLGIIANEIDEGIV